MESLRRDSTTGVAGLLDAYGGTVPHGDDVLKVPPKTAVVSCSASTATVCPGDADGLPPLGQTDYYLFKHGRYPGDPDATEGRYPNMTGADLQVSSVRADFDPTTAAPIVTLAFTAHGNKVFQQVTRDEAVRGANAGLGTECGALCAFAIVLDGQLRSWPSIDPKQLPHGIDPTGTGAEITGIASSREANDLALELETGGIPVEWFVGPVRVVRG